ncbi:MAG: BON domain-containing protein [Burkholderiales bacterium]|nr:BON domain-containing protein [Burkholderiales bacterium]
MTRKTSTLLAGAALLLALAAGARAESLMQHYDANRDGAVSTDEFIARGGVAEAFAEGDQNGDGRLNESELIKASSHSDRIKVGAFADDAWITAKVKAMLVQDGAVSALDVSVATDNGIVQLSGFVATPAQKQRAATIASNVDGVRKVINAIVVKS